MNVEGLTEREQRVVEAALLHWSSECASGARKMAEQIPTSETTLAIAEAMRDERACLSVIEKLQAARPAR
jgi:hypothetical protein